MGFLFAFAVNDLIPIWNLTSLNYNCVLKLKFENIYSFYQKRLLFYCVYLLSNNLMIRLKQMKNLLIGIPTLLIVALISSCDGSKKTSDNQNSGATTTAADKSEATSTQDEGKPDAGVQASDNQNGETITGTQLIENSTSRMTSKLNLTNSQPSAVKGILTQTFLDSGEKLDNVYSNEKYRSLSRDIITKSKDAIMPILDANQKEIFQKFVQH